MIDIRPASIDMSWRTGRLSPELTVEEITERLGVQPNGLHDPYKSTVQWDFSVDGKLCSIWDYKKSRWSVYDPHKMLDRIFGNYVYSDAE